ncbi:hypothetical protein [Pengzhenrongella sicca]|uniref:Uncharacterized protein n=1 Tax=Pengzhenrongella sicca TaxID=2819238 RepID=A0A8A4ZFP5_9MICO|nr:hypothetical protein [Pengzhenrongella sicca]QTE30830.1 hypothetical protein J4E96_07835 [Pengzhenrongella sicca]
MVSLNQGAWVPGTATYEYGYHSIPVISVTGAPADTNVARWAMLHDGSAYRLYFFQGSSTDTLYQFAWDGSSYAYGHNSIPVLTLTGAPADVDASRLTMLHSGAAYHAYLRRLGDPTTLYQFVWVPGTTTYQWAVAGYYPSLPVTGFPSDTDWSRWNMLHDDATYRIYAGRYGSTDRLVQGSWNAAAGQYQFGYDSIPELALVGYPADSDVGRSAMLHDGTDYRFYFQRP